MTMISDEIVKLSEFAYATPHSAIASLLATVLKVKRCTQV
jgi:hypothetical protein